MTNRLAVLVLLACSILIVTPNTTIFLNDTTVSTPESTTSISLYPDCPLDEEAHYFSFIGDCSKYWACFRGNRYLYMCPDPLWWHQEILTCDEPGDFCDDSVTATYPSTTLKPTTVVPTTPGRDPRCSEGGVTYWPQPNDCHKYVECSDGESFVVNCPSNLYFSDQFKQCVRVDQSECCLVHECRPGEKLDMYWY